MQLTSKGLLEKIMTPIIIIGTFLLIGFGSMLFFQPDNAVEEMSEEQIENQTEIYLGLPSDMLDGTIDLTPNTTET